jgi:hypothetical protein
MRRLPDKLSVLHRIGLQNAPSAIPFKSISALSKTTVPY